MPHPMYSEEGGRGAFVLASKNITCCNNYKINPKKALDKVCANSLESYKNLML